MEEDKKIEKIKKHIKDNKNKYIYTATGVAIGVCGTLIYCLKTGKFHKTTITNQGVGTNHGITNVIQQTISPYGNRLGRPGIEVVDLTTNKKYESIGLAAKHLGLDYNKLRGSLLEGPVTVQDHNLIRLDHLMEHWNMN